VRDQQQRGAWRSYGSCSRWCILIRVSASRRVVTTGRSQLCAVREQPLARMLHQEMVHHRRRRLT
jgi:hypothetical protein